MKNSGLFIETVRMRFRVDDLNSKSQGMNTLSVWRRGQPTAFNSRVNKGCPNHPPNLIGLHLHQLKPYLPLVPSFVIHGPPFFETQSVSKNVTPKRSEGGQLTLHSPMLP